MVYEIVNQGILEQFQLFIAAIYCFDFRCKVPL